jgi:hypothetical protein
MMKKIILAAVITVFFSIMFRGISLADTRCRSVECLCFGSVQMTDFNIFFKRYISALKGNINPDMALKAVSSARKSWGNMILKDSDAERLTMARISAVDAMLALAAARIKLGGYEEAKEISVPVRSEIYLIHKENNMLTPEDHMIFFHNGLMHRAEPLVQQGRYIELKALSVRMKATAEKFRREPANSDSKKYNRQYKDFCMALDSYLAAVEKADNYVDPEFGREMLERKVSKALQMLHKKFGVLYLGFPG